MLDEKYIKSKKLQNSNMIKFISLCFSEDCLIKYTLIVRRCPEGTANGSVDRGRTGDGRRGALRAPPFST